MIKEEIDQEISDNDNLEVEESYDLSDSELMQWFILMNILLLVVISSESKRIKYLFVNYIKPLMIVKTLLFTLCLSTAIQLNILPHP